MCQQVQKLWESYLENDSYIFTAGPVSQISIFSCHALSRIVTPLTDMQCDNII